jgi:nitrite reductase/ring-hydroxylating ferredoxin subunit
MKIVDREKVFARREVIGAGVVGAAYLILPEACGAGSSGHGAGPADSGADTNADSGPQATLVDGGGDCTQDNLTVPVNIAKSGIATAGTFVALRDDRYSDPNCGGPGVGNRIIVVNPITGGGYLALSGNCPHECCGAFPSSPIATGPDYFAEWQPPDDAGPTLPNVVVCGCHGSVFDVVTGTCIQGPAGGSALQVFKVCEGGGYVFVQLPTA